VPCGGCHATGKANDDDFLFEPETFSDADNNEDTGCSDYTKFVDTDKPEESYIYVITKPGIDLNKDNGCGPKMPDGTTGNEAAAAAILSWIKNGAERR
jgi:hypothetical protein